ncbi:MAG TPA: pyridoxamine 5'-phosphate oxidase family protein [Rhodospirillaceae bacterium]|nr:flavin-nucleotide-binding protein [Rhodospirillaceae bacterium]MAX62028.1 flavin-nucleotide-binding protein [Rhodospirillaceae bacterium]MBB57998.1 flavin-nucleotide-binding protein [Rhodospirillaceae bacterium]HAE02307.1 pyridoxamine 5'-phosphate oxidase family protein [Rhodospirillaceae bacterium]HAJ18507.1 pyridoxamine 5'-phosphate oxidase family protein [Rhodospirillaceae bacterium]|tara:strand:+ start:65 stop:742 length:678 start_codon:yes stop_codon:yes gene_type:complete
MTREKQKKSKPVSARSRVRLRPDRGSYDIEIAKKIIDEALVCHVAVNLDFGPAIIPTSIMRAGDDIVLHGSIHNRVIRTLLTGQETCICVTLLDSVVAGRSGFGCSMDYRCVVLYGMATEVTDRDEKERLVYALVDTIIPGHNVRAPKENELSETIFLKVPLKEFSVKIRDVGVLDVEEDYAGDMWAGRIPLSLSAGPVEDCPRLKPEISTPDYAKTYNRTQNKA